MAREILDNVAPADNLFQASNKINNNFAELYDLTRGVVLAGAATGTDHASLQTKANEAVTSGKKLVLTDDYVIDQPLVFDSKYHWSIEFQNDASLTQATNNVPVIEIRGTIDSPRRFHISGWGTIGHQTVQPTTNTNGVAIQVVATQGDVNYPSTFGAYNFVIERILFANSFRGLANKYDAGVMRPVWGLWMRNVQGANSMTGALVYIDGQNLIAHTNTSIQECFVARNPSATINGGANQEASFFIKDVSIANLKNVEIIEGYGKGVHLEGISIAHVDGLRFELVNLQSPGDHLVQIIDSTVLMDGFDLLKPDFEATSGSQYGIYAGYGNPILNLRGVRVRDATVAAGGTPYIIGCPTTDADQLAEAWFGHFENNSSVQKWPSQTWNKQRLKMDTSTHQRWGIEEVTSLVNYSITNDNHPIQVFPNNITANVTITLPTSPYTGQKIEFHRLGTGTGVLWLGNPTVVTTLRQPGKVVLVWNGTAWRILENPVINYVNEFSAADRGDSNITLGLGDSPIQPFKTALTANRTITLSTTNIQHGYLGGFRITRTGGNTGGPWTLDVGGLKSLTQNQWAHVSFDGTAWQLIGFGSL